MVAPIRGIVLARHGGRYRVQVGGETREATLRGRLKQGSQSTVLVGDQVDLARHADGALTVERILPRRSLLRRRNPGRAHGVRPVAANVDQVVVVGSARDPVWDPHLMDRFLAVAGASGLPARLVVNKCDLATSTELADPYRQAGYTVLETSAHNGVGLDRLRAVLDGAVSLLTGPTGVGKSTLLNAMQPGLELKTGAVSRRSRAGRHTTVSAEMLPLGESGFVVDTPGLRDIGLWGLEPAEVAASFPEIARWSAHCRFDNCRHLEEPDCAVAGAAARGEFSSSRLDSYRTLLVEAHRAARPWAGRGTGSGSGGSP